MSLPRTAPVKTGTEMHVLVTRQALTFSLPLWHHNCDVHGKVCPICQKDAIQDVLLELWPFMQYSGVSLAGATTSIIFVATKVTGVCRDKQNTAFVATKLCLSWQKFYRGKIMFVATRYFCHDKYLPNIILSNFCRILFTCLSQQKYACRDKSTCLSRQ